MSSIDLSLEKQTLLLQMLGSSPELFVKCANIIKSSYFDPELRKTAQFMLEYYEKYNGLPTPIQIKTETSFNFDKLELLNHEVQYCADNIEQFCRTQAVIDEVSKSALSIEKGDMEGIVERIRDAVMISLDKDMGVSFFEDEATIAERMVERIEENNAISTGWDNIDRMVQGGWRRGELWMYSAQSGGGKSIALMNKGVSMSLRGYNVLYVTLELQEDMLTERVETMLTGPNRREEKAEKAEQLAKIICSKSKNAGRFDIKYMTADVANSNDILAYIREYEAQHGFAPDVLLVDYLDILGTNQRVGSGLNVFEIDKLKATQLRAIGNSHYKMFMATASQENRGAINETEKSQAHVAGGLSKVNTVDYYISIIMTDGMRAMNTADFQFVKARSAGCVGQRGSMEWNGDWLTFESMKGDDGIKSSSDFKVDKNDSTGKKGDSREVEEFSDDLSKLDSFFADMTEG
ncbi:MAG: hypothetical protein JXR12_01255 [Neptunomonas phycophila]|uniref:DnaB family ATPase n=1 Tax=Neptunomonas phycophila TaxID=1572645 RepID=UPI003B8CDCD5